MSKLYFSFVFFLVISINGHGPTKILKMSKKPPSLYEQQQKSRSCLKESTLFCVYLAAYYWYGSADWIDKVE